jgi:hypothetical protein
MLRTSQAIDRGLRRPRTQHRLQKTSRQLFLLSSNYNKREYTYYDWYSASIGELYDMKAKSKEWLTGLLR